jgi:hypothetical protein
MRSVSVTHPTDRPRGGDIVTTSAVGWAGKMVGLEPPDRTSFRRKVLHKRVEGVVA